MARKGRDRKKKGKKRVPFAQQIPKPGKKPRQEPIESSENRPPGWHLRIMDMNGPWRWSDVGSETLENIRKRLSSFETMKWGEILGSRDHAIKVVDLCSKAQRRLKEIKQDDVDELVSLHVSGQERVWGIRDNEYLKILWWDPKHEICPSDKKHT